MLSHAEGSLLDIGGFTSNNDGLDNGTLGAIVGLFDGLYAGSAVGPLVGISVTSTLEL